MERFRGNVKKSKYFRGESFSVCPKAISYLFKLKCCLFSDARQHFNLVRYLCSWSKINFQNNLMRAWCPNQKYFLLNKEYSCFWTHKKGLAAEIFRLFHVTSEPLHSRFGKKISFGNRVVLNFEILRSNFKTQRLLYCYCVTEVIRDGNFWERTRYLLQFLRTH